MVQERTFADLGFRFWLSLRETGIVVNIKMTDQTQHFNINFTNYFSRKK